jgi:hypothetical protein
LVPDAKQRARALRWRRLARELRRHSPEYSRISHAVHYGGFSMKIAALALMSGLWCACPPVQAAAWFRGGFTAEEMLVHCSAEEKDPVKDFGRGICIGFIDGFAAGHYAAETYHAFHHRDEKIDDIYGHLCIPDTVKRGQLARIFVQFLEMNREKRKLPAGLVLEDALREAFPCPK